MTADDVLAEFAIPRLATGTRVTAFVALVVQPDAGTIRRSYELAGALMPGDAEQVLAPGALPHLTLTQCALRDAPRDRIAGYVARLDAELRGRTIPLRDVTVFPGGFLFWCVDEASPERARLQRAHEAAISLADGFLDPAANARVVEGTAAATNDDPVLVGNAREYGYAFLREHYLPHITLGFDGRLTANGFARQERPHVMTVERVVLAKLGSRGRAESVLSL